jgi:uncharacterized protein YcfL
MKINLKTIVVAASLLAASAMAQAETLPPAVSSGIAAKLIIRGDLKGLQVTDLRSQRKNDVLVVQATANNTGRSDLRLYYRFRWTDSNGMQVGDGETWKPVLFLGLQSQILNGVAYGPQAVDFNIEMSAEPR